MFFVGLAGITLWIILISLEQFRLLEDADSYRLRRPTTEQFSLYRDSRGAELPLPPSLNSSVFVQAITAPQRPLLVRFDWYSRKNTPVHIGCVSLTARSTVSARSELSYMFSLGMEGEQPKLY